MRVGFREAAAFLLFSCAAGGRDVDPVWSDPVASGAANLPATPEKMETTPAAPPVTLPTGYTDVTQSGCKPAAIADDGLDDAPAFACAFARAAKAGGIVFVPAGHFDIAATLVIPNNVTLRGSGPATVLRQPHTLLAPLLRLQAGAGLFDLQLEQQQPAPSASWVPFSDYDFQVRIEGDRATVSDVMLLNPYLGISIAPLDPIGAVGQVFISNLRGQPLKLGVRIDHALDVVHLQEFHFWPFWSANDGVLKWQVENGIAIESLRNDNPMIAKMFFFGYGIGMHFGRSDGYATSGSTSKAKISEYDCDLCRMGVLVDGADTRGLTLSQFSVQCPTGEFGTRLGGSAMFVNASGVTASIAQGDFSAIGGNVVRVEGSNVTISVDQTFVREWNRTTIGFPAFEIFGATSSILAVSNSFYGEGHGANVIGGTGVTLHNVVPAAL